MGNLALLGGPQAVTKRPAELFPRQIVTSEMENAVLSVIRSGIISDLQITLEYEKEFTDWIGTQYALAHNKGTADIHSALLGEGDEIICPSMIY